MQLMPNLYFKKQTADEQLWKTIIYKVTWDYQQFLNLIYVQLLLP